jgi:hypothetical protein
VFAAAVYDFSPDLLDGADPVARAKRHQEKFFRERGAQYEAERERRFNPSAADKAKDEEEARARGESFHTVGHPLSRRELRRQGALGNVRPFLG